jgi:hypothetical protein
MTSRSALGNARRMSWITRGDLLNFRSHAGMHLALCERTTAAQRATKSAARRAEAHRGTSNIQ